MKREYSTRVERSTIMKEENDYLIEEMAKLQIKVDHQ